MNTVVVAVILALAVTVQAGHLGYGLGAPLATGVISSRVIAAPSLAVASPLVASPLLASPLVAHRSIVAGPAYAAAPLGLGLSGAHLGAPLGVAPLGLGLRSAIW